MMFESILVLGEVFEQEITEASMSHHLYILPSTVFAT